MFEYKCDHLCWKSRPESRFGLLLCHCPISVHRATTWCQDFMFDLLLSLNSVPSWEEAEVMKQWSNELREDLYPNEVEKSIDF